MLPEGLYGLAGAAVLYIGKAAFEKLTRQATDPEITKEVHAAMSALRSELGMTPEKLKYMMREVVNGSYVKSNGSTITGDEVKRRLDAAEKLLDELDRYAHGNVHDFNGKLTPIQLEIDRNSEDLKEFRDKLAEVDKQVHGIESRLTGPRRFPQSGR